jgi:uncharacterized protein (UPF0276 family)
MPPGERPQVGIGFRAEAFEAITRHLHRLDVLEVTVEHYVYGSRRVRGMIEELARRIPIVTHGVTLSLGTAIEPDRAFLRQVAAFVQGIGAPWYSEHLAFTKTPGRDLSQLLPLLRTPAMLDVVLENLAVVKNELPVPVLLENIAYYFEYAASDMTEAAFLLRVLREGDCSLLLDLENLRINAANHRYDAVEFLHGLPRGTVRAVHLAGGTLVDGVHIDSHDRPVPAQTLRLLAETLRLQEPGTIVLERDQAFGDMSALLDDIAKIRQLLDDVFGA